MTLDSLQIERKYDVTTTTQPEESHLIFDSINKKFHHFESWIDNGSTYHIRLANENTITVNKYLNPSNRYYLIQSPSFEKHR